MLDCTKTSVGSTCFLVKLGNFAYLQDHEMRKKLSESEFSHTFQASQNKSAPLMAAILYHMRLVMQMIVF